MLHQTEMDFSPNHVENNRHSEQILEQEYERLGGNNKKIFEALMRGERLNGDIMTDKDGLFKLKEYRRRIADLKPLFENLNIKLQEKILKGGCKEWWINVS